MFKKILMLLAALCFTAAVADAASTNSTLTIRPNWKKGDIQRYEMIKTLKKTQDGKITDTTSRTDLTVEVLSVTNNGAIVAWTLGQTQIDDADSTNRVLLQKTSNLFQNFRIIFELDANGVILKIQNRAEMQATGQKMIALMIKELLAKKFAPDQVEKIHTQILSSLASEEQLLLFVAREPRALFLGLGSELAPNQPTKIPCDIDNPIGPGLIPIDTFLTLENVDTRSNIAHLAYSQSLKRLASDQTQTRMKTFAQRFKKSDADSTPLFSITSRGTYDLDLTTYWYREFTTTQLIQTRDMTLENTLTMKRITR
jgi:hypothetical protein